MKKLIFVGVVFVLLLTGCGVSKEEYESLTAAKNSADKRVTQLENELKDMKKESLTVEKMYERFNDNLTKDINLAKAYLVILNGNYSLYDETRQANDKYDELTSEKSGLYEKITLGEFSRLKVGMSFEQVSAVIGSPGVVLDETGDSKIVTFEGSLYGSSATISFKDGKLFVKSQIGL